jgi:hypothetical protein
MVWHGAGHLRFEEDMLGAAIGNPGGNPGAGAAECVCRNKKAQDFFLRESKVSRSAVKRLLADHVALAIHCGINL